MNTMHHKGVRADLRGLIPAIVILTSWGILFSYGIFLHPIRWNNLSTTLALVLVLAFLNTGLFITAHDAMHGVVVPGRPRLNDAIGRLCVFLYAGFSWNHLRTEHHRHHLNPGVVGADPDFHSESKPGFVAWYLHFFAHYFRWWQLVGILAVAISMQVFLGAEQWNPLTFWALPGLLSSVQLFTFGTYLPHRRSGSPFQDRHQARSNDYPVWLSFITCYHFGYHWEHHERPQIPWWRLHLVRSGAKS